MKSKRNYILLTIKLLILLCIPLVLLINIGVIDRIELKKTYHNYKIKNIEKIHFGGNYLLGNSENNINNYGGVVARKEEIFYVKSNSEIYKTDKDFNNEIKLVERSSSSSLWYLNLLDDWLFYREGKAIKRIKTDGSRVDTIFGMGYVLDLHLIDNWLYFIFIEDDSKVYKMTVNGEELQRVINKGVSDIAIYNNQLYYSYIEGETAYLKTLDLKDGEEKLIANLHIRDMILQDNIIYYIDGNNNKLYQYNLITGRLEKLTEVEITKFLWTGKGIYFMGKGEEEFVHPGKGLYKICLDGKGIEMINDNLFMEKINLTGEWLLYKSSTADRQPPSLKRIHINRPGLVIEMEGQ